MTNEERMFRAIVLQQARNVLEKLRTTSAPDPCLASIVRCLSQIKAGYEELYILGTKSAIEAEAEVHRLAAEANVRGACQLYANLPKVSNPETYVRWIDEKLTAAKAGFEVLDVTKTPLEIRNFMLHWGGSRLDRQLATKLRPAPSDAMPPILSMAASEKVKRIPNPPPNSATRKRSPAKQSIDAVRLRLIRKIIQKGQAAKP